MNTCAILPVDKPAGWTSFDVLAKLRGALGTRRLGHAGTLDPMATGVLAVFIGNATAAADRQPDHDKTYEATIRLGLRTDTGDVTGTALETAPVTVGEAELKAVLPQFMGRQMQLPPMYSAVKINGQPLYKAARKGQTVERTPRPITIYEITYLGSPAQGDYTIRVSCSKGTYIRVLAEDIGTALGVPATLAALRRTRAGAFKIEECHTLPEILAAAEAGTLQQSGWLLPVEHVFASLPALTVDDAVKKHLFNGCPTSHYRAQDGKYRVYDAAGTFLGLANVTQGGAAGGKDLLRAGVNACIQTATGRTAVRSTTGSMPTTMNILNTLAPVGAPNGSAVALGYFDGVHLGHRRVLGAAVEYAAAHGLTPAAFTFSLPGGQSLKGGRILSAGQKHARVAALGITAYMEPPFESFRSLSPEDFVNKILVECFAAKAVFCGDNFTFGAYAAGNVDRLKELCAPLGIAVTTCGHGTIRRADGFLHSHPCRAGGRPHRGCQRHAAGRLLH